MKTEESARKRSGPYSITIMVGSSGYMATYTEILSSSEKYNQEAKATIGEYYQGKEVVGIIEQ